MKEHTREEPHIISAAERQMRAWSLVQETVSGASPSHRVDAPHARLGNFITISREAGAGGSRIAEIAGQRLGWDVLDRNLVACVAERYHLSQPMLELVDETGSNWAYDIFGPWLDRKIIPHEKYVVHLARIVIAAARRGNVVIVGRGGAFLLPPGRGLAVRIIATEKYRVRRIMEKYAMAETQARQYIATVDRGRREFVSRFFHRDVADPHLYDLVINVDFLGPEAAAEEIVAAWGRREARLQAAATPAAPV
jgi:cytidylate kinase